MSGQVAVLLRLRLRLLLRSAISGYTRRSRLAAPGRLLLFVFLALWILATAVFPATVALQSQIGGAAGRLRLTPLLSSGISAVTLLIFFYAILSLVATLTYRSDLQLLLITPISPRLVMAEKLASASLGFSGIVLLGLPLLLGVAVTLRLGPGFVLLSLLVVVLAPIAPVSLAMMIVLAVLGRLPPARARSVTTLLGVGLGVVIFVGSQLLVPAAVTGGPAATPPSLPGALPTTWPGRALASAALGDPASALGYLLATVGLAAVLFGLAVSLAARMFTTGSATYHEAPRRHGGVGKGAPVGGAAWAGSTDGGGYPAGRAIASSWARGVAAAPRTGELFGPGWRALVYKEWLALRRDTQRLAQLAYPLLIVGFFAYRSFTQPNASGGLPVEGTLFGVVMFVALLLSGTISAPIVNREGRSLYLLAISPAGARTILFAKWAVCVAPVVVLVEVVLVAGAIVLGTPAGELALGAPASAALVISLTGSVMVVNLIWPKLIAEEGAKRQTSVIANFVSFAVEMVLAATTTALLVVSALFWPTAPGIAILAVLGLVAVNTTGIAVTAVFGPRLLGRLLVRR